jgi:hypothetical protein
VTIAGSWAHYRARVLQYFQQLAVITPYAGTYATNCLCNHSQHDYIDDNNDNIYNTRLFIFSTSVIYIRTALHCYRLILMSA